MIKTNRKINIEFASFCRSLVIKLVSLTLTNSFLRIPVQSSFTVDRVLRNNPWLAFISLV